MSEEGWDGRLAEALGSGRGAASMGVRAQVLLAAVAAGAVVWLASGELAWPARAYLVVLLAILPPFAVAQANLVELEGAELPRVPIYLSSLVSLWFLGLLALGAGVWSGFGLDGLGLRPLGTREVVAWTAGALGAAMVLAAVWRGLGLRETAVLEALLPRTGLERVFFVALSLSAGICEELVFRGFLIGALEAATGWTGFAVILSATVFGVVHAYQSRVGILRAGLLGLVLTVPYLATGSLIPSMLAHFLYDVVVGLWLADWLLRR